MKAERTHLYRRFFYMPKLALYACAWMPSLRRMLVCEAVQNLLSKMAYCETGTLTAAKKDQTTCCQEGVLTVGSSGEYREVISKLGLSTHEIVPTCRSVQATSRSTHSDQTTSMKTKKRYPMSPSILEASNHLYFPAQQATSSLVSTYPLRFAFCTGDTETELWFADGNGKSPQIPMLFCFPQRQTICRQE